MKIKIEVAVPEPSATVVMDLNEIEMTQEKWDNLSMDSKKEVIQDYVDLMALQPYWNIASFKEI